MPVKIYYLLLIDVQVHSNLTQLKIYLNMSNFSIECLILF